MKSVIVIGAGNWGKNLIRNFYQLGRLAGVVEIDAKNSLQIAQTYPDIALYQNYSQALETDISGIVIATPVPTHYLLAKKALEAGKDVFIEKPMTLKTEEARELAQYAEQRSCILMVGHLLLYQPAINWMQKYIHEGYIGKILHISTVRNKLGKIRAEENVWWSFAPHDISVIFHLLGENEPHHVQARGQAIIQPNIIDNIHVDLSFGEGKTAHIHCSWYWPVLQRTTTVIGSEKMLVYDEINRKVTIYNKKVDANLHNIDGGSEQAFIEVSEPLRDECQHFLDCMKTRKRPISDAWNGVAVVSALEKVQEVLNG